MIFQHELKTTDNGKSVPPKWANEATHYFENPHGEQWIAMVKGKYLYVSGLDIGWEVMKGTAKQINEFMDLHLSSSIIIEKFRNNENVDVVEADKLMKNMRKNPFYEYSLNSGGEKSWLLAVMESSLKKLRFAEFNKKETVNI